MTTTVCGMCMFLFAAKARFGPCGHYTLQRANRYAAGCAVRKIAKYITPGSRHDSVAISPGSVDAADLTGNVVSRKCLLQRFPRRKKTETQFICNAATQPRYGHPPSRGRKGAVTPQLNDRSTKRYRFWESLLCATLCAYRWKNCPNDEVFPMRPDGQREKKSRSFGPPHKMSHIRRTARCSQKLLFVMQIDTIILI